MNIKSVIGWCAFAFVVFWVIEKPAGAAQLVHNTGVFLTSAAHGVSSFCLHLRGGG